MTMTHRVPWVSLVLLLAAYTTFGNFLSAAPVSWQIWAIAIAWVLLLATFFMAPLERIRNLVGGWLQTDTSTVLLLIIVAALMSLVVIWWHVFLYAVAIVGAEALARLDIQSSRLKPSAAFWILATTSLIGLGLGGVIHNWA